MLHVQHCNAMEKCWTVRRSSVQRPIMTNVTWSRFDQSAQRQHTMTEQCCHRLLLFHIHHQVSYEPMSLVSRAVSCHPEFKTSGYKDFMSVLSANSGDLDSSVSKLFCWCQSLSYVMNQIHEMLCRQIKHPFNGLLSMIIRESRHQKR